MVDENDSLIDESSEHKRDKIKMIRDFLSDIKERKEKHYKKFCSLRGKNATLKAVINALNSVSVCSIVLTFTPVNEVVNIVALSATTASTIISAVASAYELESKVYSHQTSYLQYVDIHRDISARLYKNGLSSKDLDGILSELNARLGLIEDNSLPIGALNKNQSVGVKITSK